MRLKLLSGRWNTDFSTQEARLQERSRTERAEQRANIASQQANEERRKKQKLMDYLRSIGVDPDRI